MTTAQGLDAPGVEWLPTVDWLSALNARDSGARRPSGAECSCGGTSCGSTCSCKGGPAGCQAGQSDVGGGPAFSAEVLPYFPGEPLCVGESAPCHPACTSQCENFHRACAAVKAGNPTPEQAHACIAYYGSYRDCCNYRRKRSDPYWQCSRGCEQEMVSCLAIAGGSCPFTPNPPACMAGAALVCAAQFGFCELGCWELHG